jgi:excisionase family DNA binding protein
MPRQVNLLTTTQAAALVGISVRTFWRLVNEGHIRPAGVIGTANVYYRDEVVAMRRRLYEN